MQILAFVKSYVTIVLKNHDGRVINGLKVETYFDNDLVRALLPAQLVYSSDRPVASRQGCSIL